jgi:hypothetical protein
MFLGCQPCCDCDREDIRYTTLVDVTDGPPQGGWDVSGTAGPKPLYVRRNAGTFSQTPAEVGFRGLTFDGCDNFDVWRAGYRYNHAYLNYRHRSSTSDLIEQGPGNPAFNTDCEGAGAAFRFMAHYEHETGDHVFMQLDHELLARGKGRLPGTQIAVDYRHRVDAMTAYTVATGAPGAGDTVTITPTGLNNLSTYPRVVVMGIVANSLSTTPAGGYVWAAEHTACHWKVGYVVSGVETVIDEWTVYGAGDYILELGVSGNVCTYRAYKTIRFTYTPLGRDWGQSFVASLGTNQGQTFDSYHINPATEVAASFIVPAPLSERDYGSVGVGARPTEYAVPGGLESTNFLGTRFSDTTIADDVSSDIVEFPEVTAPRISSGFFVGQTSPAGMFGNVRTTLFRLPCEPGWEEADVGYTGTTLTAEDRASPQRLCRIEVRDRVPGKPSITFWRENFNTNIYPLRLVRYDPHQIGGPLWALGSVGVGMRCDELASVTLNRRDADFFDLTALLAFWQAADTQGIRSRIFARAISDSLPTTDSVSRMPDSYYLFRKDITPASPAVYQFVRTFNDEFGPQSTTLDVTIEWLYFYWENYRERTAVRQTVTETTTTGFGNVVFTSVTHIINNGQLTNPYLFDERYYSPVDVYA